MSFRVIQNGYAIRAIRLMRGRSGAGFAAQIGIAPGTLANIEAERRSTTTQMLARRNRTWP